MQIIKRGLTSYQIKWIALIVMTIDHLGAFGFEIPIFADHVSFLRRVGRIAAPLFLYMIAEGARYTRSKPKFILRLYLAGVLVGLFTALTNFFFGNIIGIFSPGNIMFTFFFTVLYIYILEGVFTAIKTKQIKHFICFILALIATFLPYLLYQWIYGLDFVGWDSKHILLLTNSFDSFFPNPLYVDYSLLFVLMGVIMYFAKTRKYQCVVFACFCVLCYIGSSSRSVIDLWPFNGFFGAIQYLMVMALPFMFLYNGKRGKEQKLLFYIYYPVHRYVISIFQAFLT